MRAITGRLILLLTLVCIAQAQNAPFKLLHSFGASGDGVGPSSGLIFDKQGNLYGELLTGGNMACAYGCGLIYELIPQKSGAWEETVLYEFVGGADGYNPNGGLVMDGGGNLYGVAQSGGANNHGTAFELSPSGSGWSEATLYSFCSLPNCADGGVPFYGPVLDSAGNLYGTAGDTAYELSPGPSGWTETVLYTFCSQPNCADGGDPGQLVRDSAGNLYGAARDGGPDNFGVAFTLREKAGAQWQYGALHDFRGGKDGVYPDGVGLYGGALFGVTNQGGGSKLCTIGCGTVFELAPNQNGGPIVESVPYRFASTTDGQLPQGALAFDSNGNMYGATGFGGAICGCGVVFELTPQSGGTWQYQLVYDFADEDGVLPQYGVVIHGGHLFGTTLGGGQYGVGVAFEITPP